MNGSGLPPVAAPSVSEKVAAGGTPSSGGRPPHDLPSAAELLDAVREFLDAEVVPSLEGRRKFHARVAANVVAMVARELVLGPRQEADHAARLAALGLRDEGALAEAIRSGALDDRWDEVRAAVVATVADKLAVAHPGYASADAGGPPRPVGRDAGHLGAERADPN
ncbi:MAG TPA: DUF6285 domain-containing protein [Acidimicrobiales bacterium]|nr:DUF6285 domain-containing protein [Acidimicrobiales bacterium]